VKDMKSNHFPSEAGQSLVMFVLLILAFFALLALILDGGNALSNRRSAQVAADAGALAGARQICETGDVNLAFSSALDYAVNRNRATNANVSHENGVITIEAYVTYQSFIGSFFGVGEITSGAIASAGCFAPGAGIGVLPVAWACSPPAGYELGDTCEVLFNKTYVIMDSKKSNEDFYCQEPPNSGLPAGTLDCDYDNDGINDILAGGDRSWLDLDGGGGGSSELVDWIGGGFPGTIHSHTWLGGQPGVANNVFHAAKERVGDIVILPVFDRYCDGVPV
jgi:hypothetical protein